MKILLLKDVPRVGNKGQIIEVADAYGLNAFVNKGLARIASPGDAKAIVKKEAEKVAKKEMELDKNIDIFKRLEKEVLTFKKKVDDKGHLYAKLSVGEIIDRVFELEKISISEKQISFQEVHVLGDFTCEINVNNKKYNLKIKVIKA